MRRATQEELEALAEHAHPKSALACVLAELAELRGKHGGWECPTSWNVVSGDSEEEWLRARDEYLTASDVASYIGLSKYKSKTQVVKDKARRRRITSNKFMRRGQHLEDGIVRIAADELGVTCARVRSASGASVLVAHPTIPRLAASLDAVVLEDGVAVAAVEAKATKGRVSDYYAWPATRVQLQVQMACASLPLGHIVVAAGTDVRIEKNIGPREEFLELLPRKVAEFWEDVEAFRRQEGIE